MNWLIIKRNVLAAIVFQISNIICGFILPQLLLKSFGAEVYGLTASISQFINYVSLLEGGVSGVVLAALYKPLVEEQFVIVSSIIATVRRFFSKLGIICIAYTIAIAFLYPLIKKNDFSREYIFVLTIILSFRLLVQYFLSLTYRLLLRADQRGYYVYLTQIVIVWVNLLITIVSVRLFKDILWVKLFGGLVYLIQPLMLGQYVQKHYPLEKHAEISNKLIEQRWDGLGQNIAYFIHTNTDVVILTFFSSLPNIAVYSVYLMIADALKSLVTVISSAVSPTIGTVLAKDNANESRNAFDLYEFVVVSITLLLYSCGLVLVIPFVRLYTYGLTDAEYIQPVFGCLLLLAEMVYCIREPYVNVAYAKGHFRETRGFAYTEAVLNIILSLLLVQRCGLVGVAIGTVVSMTIRLLLQVGYLKRHILFRSFGLFVKRIVILGIGAAIGAFVCAFLPLSAVEKYYQWFLVAVIVFFIHVITIGTASLLFYNNTIMRIFKRKND